MFGRLAVRTPRFDGCRHCGERLHCLSGVGTVARAGKPELRHLQAELAARLPCGQAAALLEELLPETGGLNYATTRNRTLAVDKRIEEEIRGEIDHPPVLSPNRLSEWWWGSMAHSLKQGTHSAVLLKILASLFNVVREDLASLQYTPD
jgi:hypothetical protein